MCVCDEKSERDREKEIEREKERGLINTNIPRLITQSLAYQTAGTSHRCEARAAGELRLRLQARQYGRRLIQMG